MGETPDVTTHMATTSPSRIKPIPVRRYHLPEEPSNALLVSDKAHHVNHMASYVNEAHPCLNYGSSSSKSICSGKSKVTLGTDAESTVISARSSGEVSDDEMPVWSHRRAKSSVVPSSSSSLTPVLSPTHDSNTCSRISPTKGVLKKSKSVGNSTTKKNTAVSKPSGSDELEFLDQLVHSVSLRSSPSKRNSNDANQNSSFDGLNLDSSNNSVNDTFRLNSSLESSCSVSVADCSKSESALVRRMERYNYLMNLATVDTSKEGDEMVVSSTKQSRTRSLSRNRSRTGNRSRSRPRQQQDIESLVAATIIDMSSKHNRARSLSRPRRSASRSRTRGRSCSIDPETRSLSKTRSKSRTRHHERRKESDFECQFDSNFECSKSSSRHEKSFSSSDDDDISFQDLVERSSQHCVEEVVLSNSFSTPQSETPLKSNEVQIPAQSPITGDNNSDVVVIQKNGVVMIKRLDSKNKDSQESFKTGRKVGEGNARKLASLRQTQKRGRSRHRILLNDDGKY